jgi:CheY-like chemotaxis protein
MGHQSASDAGSAVLVIDDDADVRVAAERVLRRHGFTVLVASGGVEGIELLQREAGIGIVLLDLNMPGLGGAETAREAVRINPAIRLIAMSGDTEPEVRARLQGVDLAGFVPKPFTIGELLAVVDGLRRG